MYACMFVYLYVYVCMCTFVCVHVRVCVCMYECMYIRIRMCMCVCMNVCMCVPMYVYIYYYFFEYILYVCRVDLLHTYSSDALAQGILNPFLPSQISSYRYRGPSLLHRIARDCRENTVCIHMCLYIPMYICVCMYVYMYVCT